MGKFDLNTSATSASSLDEEDPYYTSRAGMRPSTYRPSPGVASSVRNRHRSGREMADSTERFIQRQAASQLGRDQARDEKDFSVTAVNEKAGREVVNSRTSATDIGKAVDHYDGASLQVKTPGIDAFKVRNGVSGPASSASPAAIQAVTRAAAARIQADKVAPAASAAPASAFDRVKSITSTLKPGESVGIKDGNQFAGARVNADGTFDVKSLTSAKGTKFSTGPGMVRNDAGQMVPLAAEIARIGKPFNDALDRADKDATLTAKVIQKNQDSNPAVKTARAVDAFRRSQSSRIAAVGNAASSAVSLRMARSQPNYSPSRDQIAANNAVEARIDSFKRPPRAKKVTGARSRV